MVACYRLFIQTIMFWLTCAPFDVFVGSRDNAKGNNLASLEVLGSTLDGRDLELLTIGTSVQPIVLETRMHAHARTPAHAHARARTHAHAHSRRCTRSTAHVVESRIEITHIQQSYTTRTHTTTRPFFYF